MTPQILLNCLNDAYFHLRNIALIIFDEAHHARKNHPYNHVMEIYRHERAENGDRFLPKLFGMTASPGASKSDSLDSIRYFLFHPSNDRGLTIFWRVPMNFVFHVGTR